jgi:hypothetical protein
MELTPCIGIGDCLHLKQVELTNHLDIKKFHISKRLVKDYRKYPERTYQFIQKLLSILFPHTKIDIVDHMMVPFNFRQYPIDNLYLYDQIPVSPQWIPPLYQKYVVFHTKIRLETLKDMALFKAHDLPLIRDCFRKLKVKEDMTIILLGEKVIEESIEQKNMDIISIYQELMLLNEHNKVLDLTKIELCSGNPDYDDFEKDMNIIHFADINVSLGCGGNTLICHAFSQKNLTFWGPCNLYAYRLNNYKAYIKIEPFIEDIIKITS